jgi:uncharacterized protein YlxP (DUF503 family)
MAEEEGIVMVVGTLCLSLRLAGPRSLKEKRAVLSSVIPRLRQKFQASVAEVDDQELWGNATIAVAVVSGSASQALAVLQAIEEEVASHPEVEVVEAVREVERR